MQRRTDAGSSGWDLPDDVEWADFAMGDFESGDDDAS
jgi:hypothetical protein